MPRKIKGDQADAKYVISSNEQKKEKGYEGLSALIGRYEKLIKKRRTSQMFKL